MGHLLLIVNVLIWASVAVADMCSHVPGYTVHGTSCFKFTEIKETWADAEAICVADGGHLASIHSSEEQGFAVGLGGYYDDPWIGLRGTPPLMVWSDNTNVDYEHWRTGEPNDNSVSCARLNDGKWQEEDCSADNEYICRIDGSDGADQTQAYFTKIPDGVPTAAVAAPASSQTVRSTVDCAWRCLQDAQCAHFIMSENQLCETYTSLNRPSTAIPPANNYQRISVTL